MDEEKKYSVLARIDAGENKRDVAEDAGVSYGTVLRWYKEYEQAKQQNTLDKLLDMDKLILATAEQVSKAPIMVEELKGGVKDLSNRVKKLETLQVDLLATATALNTQIKSRALSMESTSELLLLVESLCQLQNAFFNKNAVQVNVQNNYSGDGERKYGGLLGDKPAD